MHEERSLQQVQEEWPGSYRAYFMGFLLSLILTCTSFWLVTSKVLSKNMTLLSIGILALAQTAVQSFLFLHVGKEAKPRWESLVFAFMVLVSVIIVIGALWIMDDLNQRTMLNMVQEHD